MLRSILVVGGAGLVVKVLYDKFVAPLTPDQIIWEAMDVDLDDIGFAVALGALGPAIEGVIRKAA